MPSKSSGMGELASVKEGDLFKILQEEHFREQELLKQLENLFRRLDIGYDDDDLNLHQEMHKSVKTWFRVYHPLVFLVAATNGTNDHLDDNDNILEDTYLVPAFSIGDNGEQDLINGRQNEDFKDSFTLDMINNGAQNLDSDYIKELLVPKVNDKSVLQYFFAEFAELPSEFDWENCLKQCRELTPGDANSHMALSQIEPLFWDNKLDNIQNLAGDNLGSEEWLKQSLKIQLLIQSLETGDDTLKFEISKNIPMLNFISVINNLIYHRFADQEKDDFDGEKIYQGLGATIDYFIEKTGRTNPTVWKNLYRAACGAVALQIYHQLELVAKKWNNL